MVLLNWFSISKLFDFENVLFLEWSQVNRFVYKMMMLCDHCRVAFLKGNNLSLQRGSGQQVELDKAQNRSITSLDLENILGSENEILVTL